MGIVVSVEIDATTERVWEVVEPVERRLWSERRLVAVSQEAEEPPQLHHRVPRAGFDRVQRFARALGIEAEHVDTPALMAALDPLRALKSDYELACLTEANAIAARGHDAVRERFAAGGASELELHLGEDEVVFGIVSADSVFERIAVGPADTVPALAGGGGFKQRSDRSCTARSSEARWVVMSSIADASLGGVKTSSADRFAKQVRMSGLWPVGLIGDPPPA